VAKIAFSRAVLVLPLLSVLCARAGASSPADSVSRALRAGRWQVAERLLNTSETSPDTNLSRMRRGIIYLATNRPREADSVLAAVELPASLAPYREYWRAQAWQRTGNLDQAWAAFDRLAGAGIPAVSDSAQFAALQVATAAGNRQRILRAATRLTERSDNLAAAGWLSLMETDSARWRGAWDALRTRYPRTVEAYRAAEQAQQRGWQPSGADKLALAEIYSRRGQVAAAMRWWNDALQDSALAARRNEIRFTAAEYLVNRRQFDDGETYLTALIADSGGNSFLPRALRLYASLHLKANNEAQMRAWERTFVDRFPQHSQVPAALLAIGMSWEREGDFSSAIATYEEIINRFPDNAQTEEARWRLGFCQFRLGRYDAARRSFSPLARTARDFVVKDQAGYWLALALKAEGREDSARAVWRRTAEFSPRSFYAVASAVACGKPVVKGRAAIDSARPSTGSCPAGAGSGTAQKPPPAARGSVEAPQQVRGRETAWPGYAEAEWLALLGQWRLARAVLEQRIIGEANTIAEMESAADAFEWLADYGTSLRWRWKAMWKRTTDDRHHELAPELLARVYPDFFHDEVVAAARENDIEPALVWAIVRQESVFDPESRSSADARGLMQIIPATGAKLAREEGLSDYTAQDLYDPGLNIRLGTRYAAQQLRQFGSIDLMAAAYNAGPHNAVRWKMDDPDVQREAISFGETRKYVKLVLRNYYVYKALYGD